MSDLPADWAIEKALAAGNAVAMDGHDVRTVADVKRNAQTHWSQTVISYARLIEAHETAPVDRKLKCAREAAAYHSDRDGKFYEYARKARNGEADDSDAVILSLMAITLYEQGYGNDPLS